MPPGRRRSRKTTTIWRAQLARRGVDIETLVERAQAFRVAVPSWGVGTGRHAVRALPRSRASPATSSRSSRTARSSSSSALHARASRCTSPGTAATILADLRASAQARGLYFDSMNSNTFQDQPGQPLSYKFGSLTPHRRGRAAAGHRAQPRMPRARRERSARARTRCGSATAATFPGQLHFRRALDRYLDSLRAIYRALPDGWRLFIEHKLYEPAFYSTVLNDWGTSYYCARELGDRARARSSISGTTRPNVNIEHDRGAPDPVRQARRVPLQRQQVRRRRPRCRLDQAVSAVPDLQRARRCRAAKACRVSTPPTCSTSRTT